MRWELTSGNAELPNIRILRFSSSEQPDSFTLLHKPPASPEPNFAGDKHTNEKLTATTKGEGCKLFRLII